VFQLAAPALASVGLRGEKPWHPRLQRAKLDDGSATLVKAALRDSEEDGGDLPPSLLQVQSSESNCPCPGKKEGITAVVPPGVQAPESQSFIETAGTLTQVGGMSNPANAQEAIPAPHVFTQMQTQTVQRQPEALNENPFAPVNTGFGKQSQMERSPPVSFQQASQDSQASQPPGTATVRLTAVSQGPQNFQQVAALQQQMQAEEVQLQNQMQYLQRQMPMQQAQQMPQQMMQQMPQLPQQIAFSQMPQQMPQQQMMEPMAFPQQMQMPQQQMPQMMQQVPQQVPMQQAMAFPQMSQQMPLMQQMPQMSQMPQQMMQQMPQMMQQVPQVGQMQGQMQPMVFLQGQYPMQYMR